MLHIKHTISKLLVKFFLPFILLILCVVALFNIGDVGDRIIIGKEKSRKMAEKLENRKIEVLELRRKMIILSMPDFRDAVRKSSLAETPAGEERIRVK